MSPRAQGIGSVPDGRVGPGRIQVPHGISIDFGGGEEVTAQHECVDLRAPGRVTDDPLSCLQRQLSPQEHQRFVGSSASQGTDRRCAQGLGELGTVGAQPGFEVGHRAAVPALGERVPPGESGDGAGGVQQHRQAHGIGSVGPLQDGDRPPFVFQRGVVSLQSGEGASDVVVGVGDLGVADAQSGLGQLEGGLRDLQRPFEVSSALLQRGVAELDVHARHVVAEAEGPSPSPFDPGLNLGGGAVLVDEQL